MPGDPRAGRPPLPKELKEAKRLTKTEFETIVNRYLWLSHEELEAAAENKSLPAVDRYLATVIKIGSASGDPGRMEFLLQRLLGKVTDKVEVSQPKPFIIEKLDGSSVHCGAKLEEEET